MPQSLLRPDVTMNALGRAGRKRILDKFPVEDFKKKMDLLWDSFRAK